MPNYITADDGAGNVQTFLLADFQAANPGVLVATPTVNFSFAWNGVVTDYIVGQPVVVTADLLASMTAAGLPIS